MTSIKRPQNDDDLQPPLDINRPFMDDKLLSISVSCKIAPFASITQPPASVPGALDWLESWPKDVPAGSYSVAGNGLFLEGLPWTVDIPMLMGATVDRDDICPEHGWLSHVFVHEAAHAVAALDRGIRFTTVTILSPASWVCLPGRDAMAGGVTLIEPHPATWVPRHPVHALEFVLAGAVAEDQALGHFLPGSYDGDLKLWRISMGATGELDHSELDELTGGSLAAVKRDTATWVTANWQRIRAVVCGLAGIESLSEVTTMELGADWTLSESQVATLAR